MNLNVTSYGNKRRAEPPPGTDLLIDCRGLPNPYCVYALKELTGLDEPVRRFLAGRPGVRTLLDAAEAGVRGGARTVAFCCLGGKHRSVYVAELFAHERRKKGDDVTIKHLELT